MEGVEFAPPLKVVKFDHFKSNPIEFDRVNCGEFAIIKTIPLFCIPILSITPFLLLFSKGSNSTTLGPKPPRIRGVLISSSPRKSTPNQSPNSRRYSAPRAALRRLALRRVRSSSCRCRSPSPAGNGRRSALYRNAWS